MKLNLRNLVLIAVATLLAACSPKKAINLLPDLEGIFSTRPQIANEAFVLIKLSEEPLLASVQTVEGKDVVDAEQAKKIEAEQAKLIAELQALSSEIKVVFKYRMVLNGVAVSAPTAVLEKIKTLTNVVLVEGSGSFNRPVILEEPSKPTWENIRERNSVKFIGAEAAHQRGIRGKGIKVGIIDTGIDFTHAMFGGAGTVDAFKAVDPAQAAVGFPNAKVVGGIDLVGTRYDSISGDYRNRIPKPDANPIDEGGHGTHVAGTVAGKGDGVNTYDGVAPDADLYAIKVFGKDGSTGDGVVIAALEYAVDPNSDADLSDRLDVVNLSLGSGYGEGHILYSQAIKNLVRGGGVSVVASAGNSGDTGYVVGAPSVAEEALSVAASVDDMDHNWKFRGVKFSTVSNPEIYTEAVEAAIAKPIEQAGDVTGELVYIGLADKDLSDEVKAQLAGKVALVDRGIVPFSEKIRRSVEAGAIGVVVANNQPGPAFMMGGEGEFAVPAIMITLELATTLKAAQAEGPVTIQFKTDVKIEKPELIDTMAAFSSKGPRSFDALVKPEIAAPGNAIVSAKMGGGAEGEAMSGTSMAAPHMAGVIALLKQARAGVTALELKGMAVGTAKTMITEKKELYSVSRQGAGRVQVLPALDAKFVADPVAVSLGEMTIETQKVLKREFTVKNISTSDLSVSVAFDGDAGVTMSGPANVLVAAGESKLVSLKFTVNASSVKQSSGELDGMIKFSDLGGEVLRVPVLAVVNRVAQVKVDSLKVSSTSSEDSAGAIASATLSNRGVNLGDAYLFNLLANDARKQDAKQDQFRSKACDLSQVSYRVIVREGVEILQVAAKTYEPMTTWDNCEISVLIDADADGVADQELVGTKQDHLKGLGATTYASILLDAAKARELRRQFEVDVAAGKKVEENYVEAVIELNQFTALDHSTIAIVEAPTASLKRTASGELSVKVAASYQEFSAIEFDDYLNNKWYSVSVAKGGQGFVDMPEKTTLAAGASETVELTKGSGSEKLVALFPHNRTVVGSFDKDEQSQVVSPSYGLANDIAKK